MILKIAIKFFILFISIPIFSNKVLVLDDSKKTFNLDSYIQIFEDNAGMTIEQIISREYKIDYKKIDSFNLKVFSGYKTFWLKLDLTNNYTDNRNWVLQYRHNPMMIKNITIYQHSKHEKNFEIYKTKYVNAIKNPVINLFIPENQEQTIYIKITKAFDQEKILNFHSEIKTIENFNEQEFWQNFIIFIFAGLCFMSIIYNLFLFTIFKDNTVFFYIFFVINVLLMILSYFDYTYNLLPFLHTKTFYFLFILIRNSILPLFSLVLFSQKFNKMGHYCPVINKLVYINLIIYLLSNIRFTEQTVILFSIIFNINLFILIFFLVFSAVKALKKSYKPSIYYLSSLGVLFLVLLYSLIYNIFAYTLKIAEFSNWNNIGYLMT
ncbi:MAG: hypothetical protein MJB14_10325, partial [Spirochaetes bacterium]|nr:hypothetical protein [Spirochaetota bacterium]